MAYQRDLSGDVDGVGPVCRSIRNKAMMVSGSRDPDAATLIASSGHCWCNHTQHVVGPDGRIVGPEACIAGRDCFRD